MESNPEFTKKKAPALVWWFTLFIVPLSIIADSQCYCLWMTKRAVHTPQNAEWSFRGHAKGKTDWKHFLLKCRIKLFPVFWIEYLIREIRMEDFLKKKEKMEKS